ncbi:putative mechanosensitive ion channel protein [Hamiltosporidium tvaerminnensis]|uniref:Putative mechanosensitive ion channel protein n=2 Tax=Hamiltosporidium TaxID=1176354 RepID=A0A4Q9L977_9MICR|nr:hypothetical protein LUQ84_000254 [Hamiltosporidium tvaerminnensis]TBU04297.1 putative mechanosensitive ion channel protein [Hamiltosporidium magnivora]TBU01801.1 putative mechanosensitive ion channel protein [Hamiltosporidium tvaerminnensis]TBU04541.1 putative mechanosensitive ion channel protein [Hamiltosporidium magnivora]TBU05195.1 putative mechanosensitive ion channel protein [Hamiltosporidium magnivora]
MTEENFDWYEDTMEIDVEEFVPSEEKAYLTSKFFDLMIKVFNYSALFALLVGIFKYLFIRRHIEILNIEISSLVLFSVIFFGSLSIIANIIHLIAYVIKNIAEEPTEKKFKSISRWLSLSLWFLLNLYLLGFLKSEFKEYYSITKNFMLCGLLTGVTFSIATLIMEYFCESFMERSLSDKIVQVDIREKIIASMKNYRYELSDVSTTESQPCTCADVFFWNRGGNTVSESDDGHINLARRDTKKVGSLFFKSPELQSLYDSKTLARDVFLKASTNGEYLSFNDFSSMFPSTQIALQAFVFFDSNDSRDINKKEFRDTIIQFYMDRVNLEKSFGIAKGFVDIIGDIFFIIVSIFLILAWLVIFGIPLSQLAAFALSSALLLNFVASGLAVDMYYNIMFIISHPYDIGDEIILENVDYKVYRVGLTSTSVLAMNGGEIKFLNSQLWKKSIINMTRAPEKILIFNFILKPELDLETFRLFKVKMHDYLKERTHDFFENFSFQSSAESATTINALSCSLILKSKSFKTKAKKFHLRVEITRMISDFFEELGIKTI